MSRIESFDEGFDEGLKRGRGEGLEQGIHLSAPIIKELLKGELTHAQIAERYSVSFDLVAKLAEELN
jgi:predicted transposase YdaD